MLYKPSNPSPYNSVVDYNTSSLAFTASCISTSDIGDMRLAIKDDSCEYYLPVSNAVADPDNDVRYVDLCISSSSIKLAKTEYKTDEYALDDLLDFTNGYKIVTSNYTRAALSSDATISGISDIIKPLKQYRWQVRLYENNCNTNIGYGFVQSVYTASANIRYSEEATHILKVRPHTNMFWNIQGDDAWRFNSFSNNTTKQQLTSFYDDSVHYQIEVSGGRYDIVAYYYSNSKNNNTNLKLQPDSYGQPLFAYVEIKADSNLSVSEGDEYSIYTNHIDSNEYYFSCRQLSEVKFRGRDDSPINEFTSIDELDKNPDDHIYSPTHSNVQIKGSFDSSSSATINYYRATLYQVLSSGEDIQIHDSGYVYASEVDYDCKDLLSGNTYKLVISATDTYGNAVSKGIYIKPNCGSVVKPTLLTVKPYPKHNSIILDFGKLISIPGRESNPHDRSVMFNDLYGVYHSDTKTYTLSADKSVFNPTASNGIRLFTRPDIDVNIRTCSIAPDNTVVYEDIDGVNKNIECHNPLISVTFRCNHNDTQTIFDFVSDITVTAPNISGCRGYTLIWENYRFCLHEYIYVTNSNIRVPVFTSYTDENGDQIAIPTGYTYLKNYRVTVSSRYYSPYGNIEDNDDFTADAIHKAMKSTEDNYSVPYLAHEDILTGADENDTTGDCLYMHTESPARDFWWQVVVSKNYWYIKCLNPPDGYYWEGGDTEWLN